MNLCRDCRHYNKKWFDCALSDETREPEDLACGDFGYRWGWCIAVVVVILFICWLAK